MGGAGGSEQRGENDARGAQRMAADGVSWREALGEEPERQERK